jgi:predicted RecB family nuclease
MASLTESASRTFITKSKYIAGVQCLKRLYLAVHSPELGVQPDDSNQSIMEQGQQVGLLARKMFPAGVIVESRDRDQAIRATRELLANPETTAIFEAAFAHDDVFVRIDILQRDQGCRWRLIEVKSATQVKDHYLADIAIQHRVVTGSGVDLAASCLAYINRDYIYQGGLIDVHQFFKIKNLTHQVEGLQPELIVQLRSEFRVLAMPEAPQIPAGRQCIDPFTCEFYDNCNVPVPDDHISRLPRIHASTVTKLFALGVESIHDIPKNYRLTERLRRACTSVQMRKPWYDPELEDELGKLTYPLYFMDFETVNPAIPRFAGMRPYDQIPFQWSVHVLRQPGAAAEHFEFLANDTSDPRPAFVSSLCDALGDDGSIFVYSQQFESQRLSELASRLSEFSGKLTNIQKRLWDLLPLVRDHVYHPKFGGSFSLKSVLPALVPEMTYEGMEVADGQAAGLAWESLIHDGLDHVERDRVRKSLLDYCGQDTLAMLRLVEKLQHVSV